MIRVLAREFYTFYVLFILDLDEICNCCLIEQKTIQHCLNNNFFLGGIGENVQGEEIGNSWQRQKCYHNIMFTYFFFIDFHTHALQIFFSCLWQNVYTILFSFSERAWSQFYWLPRPREHNRVGSWLALRGSFIKCIFTNGN